VQKTALEKQIGNELWDNHATILLSTVKADRFLSKVTLDKIWQKIKFPQKALISLWGTQWN